MNNTPNEELITASEWLACLRHEARGTLIIYGIEQPTQKQIDLYVLYGDNVFYKAFENRRKER